MVDEVSTEEALDKLVDDEGEEIATPADQDLLKQLYVIKNFEDVPRYKAPLSGEKEVKYETWEVEEVLTDLRSVVGSWAEENGYDIEDNTIEVLDEFIDDQVLANLEGEIETDKDSIEFGFYGGWTEFPTSIPPDGKFYTNRPGESITVYFDGFNGDMTEEYRELNAITEPVLSKYGRIVTKEPDHLLQ